MIRAATLLVLAFIGMASAWTGNGYYDRYSIAPMRADQDGYGFGSLFESNRRMFQNSRMNTSGEYVRRGMDYYPNYDYGYGGGYGYGSGYGGYGGYSDYGGYGSRGLTRYRPRYDYGYNGRYGDDSYGYGGGYGGRGRYGNR